MKRIFKWIYKPSGNCPVQSEGYFLNYYFYFRARGRYATIEFYNSEKDFDSDNYVYRKALKTTHNDYEAGYLSKKECIFLIIKGCFLFIFKRKNL